MYTEYELKKEKKKKKKMDLELSANIFLKDTSCLNTCCQKSTRDDSICQPLNPEYACVLAIRSLIHVICMDFV